MKINKCLIVILSAVLWQSVIFGQVPQVPQGHPRLYLTQADVVEIQAKVATPEFSAKWANIKNYFSTKHPAAAALVYLVDGNTTKGRWAINQCLTAIQTSNAYSRWYDPIHYSAIVYDWCYPLLTEQEKQIFITNFQRILALSRSGYPALITTNSVSAGTTEGEVLTGHLPAGIAIYDEDPQMYNAAAQLFFDKFVPVRDIVFQSHTYHQGDSYICRVVYDMFGAWMFKRMSDIDVYSGDAQYVPYTIIYNRRPDGLQIRRSDTFDLTGNYGDKRLLFMLTGTYYNDPYLIKLTDDWSSYFDGFPETLHLIFREPAIAQSGVETLPLTKYFAYPMGEMTARTGWDFTTDSPDSVFFMRIGGIYFHGHQHRDMGTFQIYHKGPLATNSGIYQSADTGAGTEHFKNYYHQTLSHNGLLIFDPAEDLGDGQYRSANDGGQMMPNDGYYPTIDSLEDYSLADDIKHSFGPDEITPEYSYISGDITDSYTNKVSLVKRSMVTLNLGNADYPAAMVVFDKIVSASQSFKKTWLIHSHNEPQIAGSQYVITNNNGDYSGKLVGQSILPHSSNMTKIGGSGYEFWLESTQTNYAVSHYAGDEPAAWRIEISPSSQANQDFFLNVMTVMDSSMNSYPGATEFADIDNLACGAKILDRAVLFGKGDDEIEVLKFYLPGNSPVKLLITDLAQGEWVISQNGRADVHKVVEEDCGVIYATLDPAYGVVTAAKVPGLVSHYEFQGDLLNSIPDGGDGFARNGAVSTCADAQESGFSTNSCFGNLTGTKWVYVGYSDAWAKPALSQQLSIAMWVKTGSTAYSQLIGRRYEWRIIIQNNKPVLSISSPSGLLTLTGSKNINDNIWHHLAATYDATTGKAVIYIDGQPDVTLTQTSPLVSIVSSLRCGIGGLVDSSTAATYIYDGLVDDVRIYNESISAWQVQYLYSSTRQEFCSGRPQMDYTGDCEVAIDDFVIFAGYWLDGVEIDDLEIFAQQWLDCGLLDMIDCR